MWKLQLALLAAFVGALKAAAEPSFEGFELDTVIGIKNGVVHKLVNTEGRRRRQLVEVADAVHGQFNGTRADLVREFAGLNFLAYKGGIGVLSNGNANSNATKSNFSFVESQVGGLRCRRRPVHNHPRPEGFGDSHAGGGLPKVL